MKKILLLIFMSAFIMTGCNKEEESPRLTEDEYPRLISSVNDDYTVYRGEGLQIHVYVTPAEFVNVEWSIIHVASGVEHKIAEGLTLEYVIPHDMVTGDKAYTLRIKLSTSKYTTHSDHTVTCKGER